MCAADRARELLWSGSAPFFSEQIIQRQLEQVEEKQRQLEERGVAVEKALRGEAGIHHNLVWFSMFSYQVLVQ